MERSRRLHLLYWKNEIEIFVLFLRNFFLFFSAFIVIYCLFSCFLSFSVVFLEEYLFSFLEARKNRMKKPIHFFSPLLAIFPLFYFDSFFYKFSHFLSIRSVILFLDFCLSIVFTSEHTKGII